MADNNYLKTLNSILKKTVQAIETSKAEMYDIVEHSRTEHANIERDLIQLKEQICECIDKVDTLEKQWNRSKMKLASINKGFSHHNEKEMQKAYKEADDLRMNLMLQKEREQFLIQKRNDLELRLKGVKSTVQKAENLINHVGVALNFLSGDLKQLSDTVEDLKGKQNLGIKVLKAQEEERKRVAREIHDGPAQSMANLIMKAELCEKLLGIDVDRAKGELKNLKNHLRTSIHDVRRIIYDLRPMTLDDLGLISTLEQYFSEFEHQTRKKINFIVHGEVKVLENIISLTIFRVMQEALNNIRKHAEATNIKVYVGFTPKHIDFLIIDDGKGFDLEEVYKRNKEVNSGFGLQSMKERVELLNGQMEIRTRLNEGTKYVFRIPIDNEVGGE